MSLAAQLSNVGNIAQQVGNQANVTLGGTYSANPTITYTPLAGSDFADTLLSPLAPQDLLGLIFAGVSARLLFGVSLHSLGDYANEIAGTQPNLQADPEFVELIELMDELLRSGWLALTSRAPASRDPKSKPVEKAEAKGKTVFLLFKTGRPDPRLQAGAARLRELLQLNSTIKELELVFRLGGENDPKEIVFRTRSLIEILGDFATAVEVPEGTVVAEQRASSVRVFAPDVKVRSSPQPPVNAHAAVRYEAY